MVDIKSDFQLVFPENLKKDTNLSTTQELSFDDLGDFLSERNKIQRIVEKNLETDLRVDYSDFSSHVFFDSAQAKFDIAKKKILNEYPYGGNNEEKDAFRLTGSGYEDYVLDQWPKHIGYAVLNGSDQFVSASDPANNLLIGTSSFHFSAWVDPISDDTLRYIVDYRSGSNGFYLAVTGSFLSGVLMSGSTVAIEAISYAKHSGSFNNVGISYDKTSEVFSLYISGTSVSSASFSMGPLEISPDFVVGRNNSASFGFYSGSIDDVRFFHTSSDLYHSKNYNRSIDAEDFVKLHYKFNEGVTGTGSVDKIVVDYSPNSLHGELFEYAAAARVSGTALLQEEGDPILYSFHSSVIDFTASVGLSASVYDNNNNNFIFNMIPGDLLIEDEKAEGLQQAFSLTMARFFDEIKLYIDQFDNLRITNYDGVNDTPDMFLPLLQRYFGWKVTEHFGDANPLAFFFGEGILASGSLEVPLVEIKNQFWRRTLNNLPYLLKTKGKRHNLDAFFNVLGVNRENIVLKEYGYLPGASIQDTRIHKERVTSLLGIGTGSFGVLSSSFVKVTASLGAHGPSSYTVETLMQLPYFSASYSGSLLTGSVWQMVDPEQVTGSYALLWNRTSLNGDSGKFILTGSDGQQFNSEAVTIFDGDIVYVAAGLDASQLPFIEIKTLDNDEIDLSSSNVGTTALSGVFTGSKYDFVMGANSGTAYFSHETQGFYGEYRVWDRPLSGSEMEDHAFHFQSVGIKDPKESPHPLFGYWALNENLTASSAGLLGPIPDLSRNDRVANGVEFTASLVPYDKFLFEYNYLSPDIDLKWSENKVRVRNKTELTIDDVATDTNEVSLEFNLVEALNEDITKIFSTFDIINNDVGQPVNKYRDEYTDLEILRRVYFDRLGDNINFASFFKLFRWFDKKLSDSIKQLLPARVRFVGGEQVVESHFLERSKYGYKYPVFRTPQKVPEIVLRGTVAEYMRDADPLYKGYSSGSFELFSDPGDSIFVVDAEQEKSLPVASPSNVQSALVESRSDIIFVDQGVEVGRSKASLSAVSLEVVKIAGTPVSQFLDGISAKKINPPADLVVIHKQKLSGDTKIDEYDSNSGVNFRNEYIKEILSKKDRDNE